MRSLGSIDSGGDQARAAARGLVDRATTPRGAAIVIATATIVITLAAGILMTVLDRENYPTIGSGSGGPSRRPRRSATATTFRRRCRTAPRRARDVLRDRLPDRHHRRDHEHVRRALARLEQEQSDAETRRLSISSSSTGGSSASRRSSSSSHREPSASDAEPPAADHFRRLDERLDRIEVTSADSSVLALGGASQKSPARGGANFHSIRMRKAGSRPLPSCSCPSRLGRFGPTESDNGRMVPVHDHQRPLAGVAMAESLRGSGARDCPSSRSRDAVTATHPPCATASRP